MYNLHKSIGFLIHRTDVKLTNFLLRNLKPYGVTPEQWGIIVTLGEERGYTQKEIANHLEKDQTTIVRMIVSMEKKGLVKRVDHPQDKRSQLLFLTEKGTALKKTIVPVVQEIHMQMTERLTAEEEEILAELLNKVHGTVK